LFLLESFEEEDDGVATETTEDVRTEDTPVFSLQALAGVAFTDTMKLEVGLGSASLVALLDSGSTHNFISEAAARRTGLPLQHRPRLTAMVANGERVACVGVIRGAPLTIGGASFHVVLATRWLVVLGPIMWDFGNRAVSFTYQGRTFCWQGLPSPHAPAVSTITASSSLLKELLADFDDVFDEPHGLPPSRSHDHSITLMPGKPPVVVRPYRYPALHKDELEHQCATMLDQGIIRCSSSAFSSPVLLVKKADVSWRFCIDYRTLNAITIKDAFPIPVVDELLDELHGARFFTKLDLRSGYHQVHMKQEDIDKTAFRTHDAFFKFLVMPFGLCNAPTTFQSLMNDVLHAYLCRFVLVFFDDILIYNASWADHLRHLRVVLAVLRQHRLFVKRSKCSFDVDTVTYSGHTISRAGVAMDPAKVQAIHDWPQPRLARAVRGFLGLAGYYMKFIHNYSTIAAPLTALLKKEGFTWNDDAAAAFSALKGVVMSAPVLALPDFTKLFVVECDASTYGFSAVLVQDGHPIAFYSRPVAPCHRSLAAYERELIGLVQAVWHWRPYLWGWCFTVKTDHYSLKYLLDQRLATIPQHHWVGKLLGFDSTVEYKSESTNTVADALSRHDTEEGTVLAISAPRFDFIGRLRHAQATELALVAIHDEIRAGTRIAPCTWSPTGGVSTYHPPHRCRRRSWRPSLRMDMRASIVRFTASAVTFIFPTCVIWCRNSCGLALLVSGTSRSIYTQRGCLCHCPCRWRSGPTSVSTLWKRYQG
jgi:hypothetical protein